MGERGLTDRQTSSETRQTERQTDKDSIESTDTVKQADEARQKSIRSDGQGGRQGEDEESDTQIFHSGSDIISSFDSVVNFTTV